MKILQKNSEKHFENNFILQSGINVIMKHALTILLLMLFLSAYTQEKDTLLVVQIEMDEEVGPKLWLKTQRAFDLATKDSADLILIHMNTYGGAVIDADSIRTRILNSEIPVIAFIDNNAASAGALIAMSCDKIYMRKGANIGAATVVNQTGEAMPDKYQSYMRSMMRSTAESHGCDTIITNGDTSLVWKRNPQIAEAMVDQDLYIANVIDSGKVLTLTASEAMRLGFCEGMAETIHEVLEQSDYQPAVIKQYEPSGMDNLLGWLMSPTLQGLLIMAIIGGIYFEMQSPGLGFPSIVALLAAILYFAPLYLEGLAAHWEIAIFILGIILIIVEIFAFPGFGVCGITGAVLTVAGLTLAMIGNFGNEGPAYAINPDDIAKAFLTVIVSATVSIAGCIWISSKFYTATIFGNRLSLTANQQTKDGYIAVKPDLSRYIGKKGIAETNLRPSGKIDIDGHSLDAKSVSGFVEKGSKIEVVGCEIGQLYVK